MSQPFGMNRFMLPVSHEYAMFTELSRLSAPEVLRRRCIRQWHRLKSDLQRVDQTCDKRIRQNEQCRCDPDAQVQPPCLIDELFR